MIFYLMLFGFFAAIVANRYRQSNGKCHLMPHKYYVYEPRDLSRKLFETVSRFDIITYRKYKLIHTEHLLYFRLCTYYRCRKCGHKKQVGVG